jgi:hypothetical protein
MGLNSLGRPKHTRLCARDASLPSPDARDLASLLQRKAIRDIPDDALGFHVQRAIEKCLKAVLALNEVEFQHTHSIGYLTSRSSRKA